MYLLFDIGGTNMRLGISEDGKTIARSETVKTPQVYVDGVRLFVETAKKICGEKTPQAIAGCLAGPVDRVEGKLLAAPNIPDWAGKPFVSDTGSALGVNKTSIHIENDAALAALGEAMHGAGRGFDIVAYITVGTGVGGAKVVRGDIDSTSVGFEPGHQVIDIDNTMEPRGDTTLEGKISGTAVERLAGKKPKEITDPVLWDTLSKTLAFGVANSITMWSPDVVVLGGSMITGSPAISVEQTAVHLDEILKIYPQLPPLKKAELGDIGGLYGALEYAKRKSSNDTRSPHGVYGV